MKVPAWSYSKLRSYETCPQQYLHYHILKDIPEHQGQATNEGLDAHRAYDQRIKTKAPLPLPYAHQEHILAKLEKLPGEHFSEQKLALTGDFKPTGFFSHDVWFRTVVDFCAVLGSTAAVVDYKTGKPGSDMTQLQLMSATVMHYDQRIDRVRARLLFMNHDKAEGAEFRRADIPAIWSEILPRVRRMQDDDDFIAKPSGLCIRHCSVTSCKFHGRGSR